MRLEILKHFWQLGGLAFAAAAVGAIAADCFGGKYVVPVCFVGLMYCSWWVSRIERDRKSIKDKR